MSTVIIGGGDHVRSAVSDIENASLGWSQQQRDDAETLFKTLALCLNSVACDGTAAQVSVSGP